MRDGRIRRTRGFALLITITLLAFLVLLLVSLASLTRVETQVASNNQQLSQARQNALLALNVAIGQLQKYVGPDQRVTARAEILPDTAPAVVGATLWTGVWGNSQSAGAVSGTATAPMNWLVSGNETASFDWDVSNGRVTSISSPPIYQPTQAPVNLTVGATAVSTDITMSDGTEARLLVGSGSVGGTLANYVVAPLRSIEVPASQVPGLGTASTPTTIGRYAWWVGDEGVKARANLIDATATAVPGETATAADARNRLRYMVAQRDATESLTGFLSYDPATVPGLEKAVHPSQLPLLPAPATITTNVLHDRYHDLSTTSLGVLSDTLNGGLKKDLTAAFAPGTTAANSPTGAVWSVTTPPAGSSWVSDMSIANGYDGKGVSWQFLRSYYQLGSRVTGSGATASIAPIAQDVAGNQHGIVPVVAFYQVFIEAKLVESPVGSGSHVLELRHIPAVVLWNPYDITLADATYSFAYGFTGTRVRCFARISKGDSAAPSGNAADAAVAGAQVTSPYFQSAPADDMQFSLSSGALAPGASYVYTLPADVAYSTNVASNYVLTRGWGAGAANARGILVTSASFTLPPLAGTNHYNPLFWAGAGAMPAESATIAASNTTLLPNGDRLLMKLGTTEVAQFINGNNATQLPGSLANVSGGTFATAPSGTTVVGWAGLQFGLKTTALSAKLPSNLASSRLVRWLADGNVRATHSSRSAYEQQLPGSSGYSNGNPSYARRVETSAASSVALSAYYPINDGTALAPFGYDYANLAPVVLFGVPRTETRVASIGGLQHVNAYRILDYETAPNPWRLAGNFYPGYPIGNSWAIPRVGLDRIVSDLTANNVITGSVPAVFFDHSYLYNRALWDGYFFSTVPDAAVAATPVSFPLPNSRHVSYGRPGESATTQATNLRDTAKAAAGLMVAGAFNINSVSVEAWRALLAGTNNVPVGGTVRTDEAPFPRLIYPVDDGDVMTATTSASSHPNTYQGYRFLNAAQLTALATAIVTEVRNRGPFVSLADFVNRALVDSPSTSGFDERTMGALARALDVAGVNAAFGTGSNPTATMLGASGSYASMPAPTVWDGTPIATGAPGWVTQADLLQTLGPVLSARSDTFTIRAYGEVNNPLLAKNDAGHIQGRAWCEAVVQRLPDYVNEAAASSAAGDPADTVPALLQNSDNRNFGRRFQIMSFRWLSPSDI